MAAKKKAAKAAGGAAGVAAKAKSSPAIQRVIEDEDVRENFKLAYEAGRDAFERLTNGKPPHKALLDDKKLQKSIQEAAENLKEAADALREGPKKKKKKRGFGGTLVLLVVGAGVALGVSEDLRNKVLDALFGKEEEFEYTSTTSPSTPSPSGATA